MTDPLISVIMPAYNAEKFIEEAIESVQAQTYQNWELTVVDDGSADQTASIIKNLSNRDPRIKYLFQDRGKQGKARNLAIKNSSGEYLAFLDADDLWQPEKLAIQANIIESRPDIDLIFTKGYNLFSDGGIIPVDINVKEWEWEHDADLFIEANQIPVLSVMVRRKAVEAVNYFSENPEIQNAEDYHLWLKLLKKGKFLSIDEKLFKYRLHPAQATYQNSNTAAAIANCLTDLISSGVINSENKAVKARMKWLIFQNPRPGRYLKILMTTFPEKKKILSALLLINKILPDNIVKKMAFHAL